MGGGEFGRGLFQGGEELGADQLGDGDAVADVADGVVELGWELLAVVDLVAVEIDLEAALADGRQGDAYLTISASDDLGCHTGSLPEIPSTDAVLDLELGFEFGHQQPPPGGCLSINSVATAGIRAIGSARPARRGERSAGGARGEPAGKHKRRRRALIWRLRRH
jgi:hypothetical protein